MANYIRQGTCNWCGQCCGAPYTFGGDPPSMDSPWPDEWPDTLIAWSEEAMIAHFPLKQTLESIEEGFGEIKITGKRYYFIWKPGYGFVTDLPPYGDDTTFENRCPLLKLLGETENPPTECAAVNHAVFQDYCQHVPRSVLTEEEVTQWQASHPACSYTWTPE